MGFQDVLPVSVLLYFFVGIANSDFTLYDASSLNTGVTISTACTNALTSPIKCDPALLVLATTKYAGYLDNSTLSQQVCLSSCSASLRTYHSSVVNACDPDEYPAPGTPANYYGDMVWAYQNSTCLQDSSTGEYCMNYFANIKIPAGVTRLQDLPKAETCSPCIIAALINAQSTGFSNYDADTAASWAAIQTACGVAPSYPTNVLPSPANITMVTFGSGNGINATVSNTTAPCLSGNYYTVVPGDDCQAIAKASNVSLGALETINNLYKDCTNLIAGASLCLPKQCQTYLVQPGDTCYSIASAQGMTYNQLLGINSALNTDCSNLISGTNICVTNSNGVYTPTTIAGASAVQTGVYATSTVLPPGPVASGTTRNCGKWYSAATGDYCQIVSISQAISVTLFEEINPSIDAVCSNLIQGAYYCVQPTSNWNETTTVAVPAPTSTPPGTTSSCYNWHIVVSGDNCAAIENDYSITMTQLTLWNPDLKNDCSNLLLDEAYCVSGLS